MPLGMTWKNLSGVALLGGIGFTVSLFIANLSFGVDYPVLLNQAKFGVLTGTVLSGLLGYVVLRFRFNLSIHRLHHLSEEFHAFFMWQLFNLAEFSFDSASPLTHYFF